MTRDERITLNELDAGKMNSRILSVAMRQIRIQLLEHWGNPDFVYYSILYSFKRLAVLARKLLSDTGIDRSQPSGCWESRETRDLARLLGVLTEAHVDSMQSDMQHYLLLLVNTEAYPEDVNLCLHGIIEEGQRLSKTSPPIGLEEENSTLKQDLAIANEEIKKYAGIERNARAIQQCFCLMTAFATGLWRQFDNLTRSNESLRAAARHWCQTALFASQYARRLRFQNQLEERQDGPESDEEGGGEGEDE